MNIKSVLIFIGICFLFACSPNDNASTTTNIKESNTHVKEKDHKIKTSASNAVDKPKGEALSLGNSKWKSKGDPKLVIETKNGNWNASYDGRVLSNGNYTLEKNADGVLLTINGKQTVHKFNVTKHTDSELQMTMIGGKGETFTYEKY